MSAQWKKKIKSETKSTATQELHCPSRPEFCVGRISFPRPGEIAFFIKVNYTKQTSSGPLLPGEGRDGGVSRVGSAEAPERLTLEPPPPEPVQGDTRGRLSWRRVPHRGLRDRGHGREHGPTPNRRTRTLQAGPGRATLVSSCAVQGAGSGPSSPPALRRAESATASQRARLLPKCFGCDPECVLVSPRRDCKHTRTHTGTGARFYFIRVVLSVNKGTCPLKSLPEPMSSLELLLSPCPGLSQETPFPRQGCPPSSRGRVQPPFLRALRLFSSRFRGVCLSVSRGACSPVGLV